MRAVSGPGAREGLVAVLSLVFLVGAAQPAVAAGELEVSPDGVSWSTELPEPLFAGVSLVPRGSASESFSVRNASGDDAFLRVVLQDVDYSSPVIGDALIVSVSLDGTGGAPAALSTATPCRVLFEGQLAAGASSEVLTSLSLADLSGTQGQGETARFNVGIQLSDDATGDLPPTSCGAPTTVIEITPFDSRVATIALVGVAPNTWQLFEEYLVLVLLAALTIGAAAQWLVAGWARRRDELHNEQQQYLEDLA